MKRNGEGGDVRKRGGSSSFLRRVCCREAQFLVPEAVIKVFHQTTLGGREG